MYVELVLWRACCRRLPFFYVGQCEWSRLRPPPFISTLVIGRSRWYCSCLLCRSEPRGSSARSAQVWCLSAPRQIQCLMAAQSNGRSLESPGLVYNLLACSVRSGRICRPVLPLPKQAYPQQLVSYAYAGCVSVFLWPSLGYVHVRAQGLVSPFAP